MSKMCTPSQPAGTGTPSHRTRPCRRGRVPRPDQDVAVDDDVALVAGALGERDLARIRRRRDVHDPESRVVTLERELAAEREIRVRRERQARQVRRVGERREPSGCMFRVKSNVPSGTLGFCASAADGATRPSSSAATTQQRPFIWASPFPGMDGRRANLFATPGLSRAMVRNQCFGSRILASAPSSLVVPRERSDQAPSPTRPRPTSSRPPLRAPRSPRLGAARWATGRSQGSAWVATPRARPCC